MQDDRTITVNADDLTRLAYFAAQGILSEVDELDTVDIYGDTPEQDSEHRANLSQWLAMAFAHGNLAADANEDDLPYSHDEILDALAGKLTSRRLAA